MWGKIVLLIMFVMNTASGVAGDLEERYSRLIGPRPEVGLFKLALEGFTKINTDGEVRQLITIVDFRLPSTDKRLWVIDLERDSTIIHTYVSHGVNTGNLYATKFSNRPNSNQSSLGFFRTGETYYGRNGYSMRLDGLEPGINHNARKRAIVVHGAWYANPSIIARTGRLGRSFGCPAVPEAIHRTLIDTIANGTVLFIYKPQSEYLETSTLL